MKYTLFLVVFLSGCASFDSQAFREGMSRGAQAAAAVYSTPRVDTTRTTTCTVMAPGTILCTES